MRLRTQQSQKQLKNKAFTSFNLFTRFLCLINMFQPLIGEDGKMYLNMCKVLNYLRTLHKNLQLRCGGLGSTHVDTYNVFAVESPFFGFEFVLHSFAVKIPHTLEYNPAAVECILHLWSVESQYPTSAWTRCSAVGVNNKSEVL